MKRAFLFLLAAFCCTAGAKVTLSGIFSDNAVLQRSPATAIFGKAAPGEKISVSYAGAAASTAAGKDGRWLVRLDLSKCDDSAHDLIVKGTNTLTVRNVITGEVWYCIGQSNMAMTVARSLDSKKNIAKSANDRIRHFRMSTRAPLKPSDAIIGKWVIASPKTTGNFSAAGYYFARKVNKETGLAVGLINPAWGGSRIESWISLEKLLKGSTPAVAQRVRKERHAYLSYNKRCDVYTAKLRKWLKDIGHDIAEKTVLPPADAKWTKVADMRNRMKGRGILWFRKEITIQPRDIKGGRVYFTFGRPLVPVDFYLDGKLIAKLDLRKSVTGGQFTVPRIPAKPGKHVIMLRTYAYLPQVSFPRYHRVGSTQTPTGWEMFRQSSFAPLSTAQTKALPQHPGRVIPGCHVPSLIWNGLVHPLLPLTMRGALWYQGEQNSGEPRFLYGDHLKALISDLRKHFDNPDLRFYAVQLPNYFSKKTDPNFTGNWVDIRAGQNRNMTTPGTAQVITIDLGEAGDIHPVNKVPVGERLAAIALRNDYGKKDLPCSSPEAVKAERKGSAVCVTFKYTDGGLLAQKMPAYYWVNRSSNVKKQLIRNSPKAQVEGFALCGKDGKWVWADSADIKNNTVTVSSARVKEPTAVRYAWQNNPTCNLYNGAGFPAAPFEIKIK